MEKPTHFAGTIRSGWLLEAIKKGKSHSQEAIVVPLNLQAMMSIKGMGKVKERVTWIIRYGRLDQIITEQT